MTNKKTTQEEINELADLSGEREVMTAPKYVLPSLKINGKEGGFFKTVIKDGEMVLDEDGRALLEEVKNPTGVILRPRRSFFTAGSTTQLFTSEGGNKPTDTFSVFEKSETPKGTSTQLVFQGTPAEIKERFPQLKMVQILYFLLDQTDEIVRLKVKGMSLGHIFDYWKEFGKDEHTFQYQTILGEKKGKNQYGNFVMNTFKKGKKLTDLTRVKEAIKEVAENIEEIEEYFKERNEEMENFQSGGLADVILREDAEVSEEIAERSTEEPTYEPIKDDGEEEIKVSEIPF
jgi:hypothetical protein